jgi:hypothetical protein
MANIVAVDFNPRVSIKQFFNEFRRNGTFNHRLYGTFLRNSIDYHSMPRRIEIRRYNIDHPYGIFNVNTLSKTMWAMDRV